MWDRPAWSDRCLTMNRCSIPAIPPSCLTKSWSASAPNKGERAFDGTLGCGNHARRDCRTSRVRMARCLASTATIRRSRRQDRHWIALLGKTVLLQYRFDEVDLALGEAGWDSIDLALLDLGICSTQIDHPSRGFSFKHDGPLDMRMDRRLPLSAADVANTYKEAELQQILRTYGEERAARPIARAICRAR